MITSITTFNLLSLPDVTRGHQVAIVGVEGEERVWSANPTEGFISYITIVKILDEHPAKRGLGPSTLHQDKRLSLKCMMVEHKY